MRIIAFLCLAWAFCLPISAQPNSQDGLTYKYGYSAMMKLGREMYGTLKSEYKDSLSSQPISLDLDVTPFVRLLYYSYPDEPRPIRGVWVSTGFIDLVNNLAHAKAIDRIQRGYFAKYVQVLAEETGEKSLRPLPNDTNPDFWRDNILDEQQSNFNSIVGVIVGIKMAHHYLGHYDKYKDQMTDANGNPVPINNLLTPREWEDAFNKGLRNAMDSGCFTEGVIPFFEAFEKMKKRPAWAVYFIPDSMKFSKVRKDMEKIQRKYLDGE